MVPNPKGQSAHLVAPTFLQDCKGLGQHPHAVCHGGGVANQLGRPAVEVVGVVVPRGRGISEPCVADHHHLVTRVLHWGGGGGVGGGGWGDINRSANVTHL